MNADDILDMIGDSKGIYVWDAQKVRDGSALAIKRKMPDEKGCYDFNKRHPGS